MIEIQALTKRFGPHTAVDNLSFVVEPGTVLGFLGPNGAGKSTTMKMITGFLEPTSGSIRVAGIDVEEDPIPARRKLGYLPEGAPLYGDMTTKGFLNFIGETRGLGGSKRREAVREAIERVELQGVVHQRIETLSKGFKRRVGLAQAILHSPDALILDEPTDGLDPNQKHEVRRLIQDMAKDKVIILSTHILEEVEAVCNRAMIIAKGKLLFDGTPSELVSQSRYHNAVSVRLSGADSASQRSVLEGLSSVATVEMEETMEGIASFTLFPRSGQNIVAELGQAVTQRGLELERLEIQQGRLDEVFRTITQAQG